MRVEYLSHTVQSNLLSLVLYFMLLDMTYVFNKSILRFFKIKIDNSSWYSR